MSLFSTAIAFTTTSTVSAILTLPANTTNAVLVMPPGVTGGPFYLSFSYNAGTTFSDYGGTMVANGITSLSGVSLLGGVQLRVVATSNPSTAFNVLLRYRTEETLNSSFLLT